MGAKRHKSLVFNIYKIFWFCFNRFPSDSEVYIKKELSLIIIYIILFFSLSILFHFLILFIHIYSTADLYSFIFCKTIYLILLIFFFSILHYYNNYIIEHSVFHEYDNLKTRPCIIILNMLMDSWSNLFLIINSSNFLTWRHSIT